jgi:hypothetical protein
MVARVTLRTLVAAGLVAASGVAAAPAISLEGSPGSATRRPHSLASEPLLKRSSLVYLGSFRLPPAQSSSRTFDYGGTALAYDPARNGLFAVGHAQFQLTAEVSIPALSRATHVASLPQAHYLQGFNDPTDGLIGRPPSCCGTDIGGQLVIGSRLYGSVYVYYDAAGKQVRSQWARPSTSLTRGRARGLFQVGSQGAGYVSGFMAAVPSPWQRPLGGAALTGNCCIPIISRTSFGPAAFSFDPSSLRAGRVNPDHPLVYYPQNHTTLGPWDGGWDPDQGRLFDGGTTITGTVFPAGSRSVLFFGTQGTGKFCYGDPTSNRKLAGKTAPDGATWCYDPTGGGKGPHTYPYQPEVWAYDASELAAVRAGRRAPWQVRPYATWRLPLPFDSPDVGGAAYDPAHQLIYLSQQNTDGPAPVIDVFRVR